MISEKLRAYKHAWRLKNADRVRAHNAEYRRINAEHLRLMAAARYQRNKAKIYARTEKWRKANQEKINAIARAKYSENKEPFVARKKKYKIAHPDQWRERMPRYRAEHGDRINAVTARRRAKKKHATPAWANQFFISEAYHLASLRIKMLGFKWHVDHIVPLQSKSVCGLHVENNLQVIPARTNHLKSNRSWPNMP